ncbi:capsule assembly Wzi family protein [Phocaeicola sp.]
MTKKRLFLLQCILLSVTYQATAQTPLKTEFAVETGATLGKGSYAPLWLTANRQGLSSINPDYGYLRAGISHSMPMGKHFGLSAGLDLATTYNTTSSFVVQQAYADISCHWLRLSIGSKERAPLMKNPELSSGGMVESNNARPVPQVRLEVPDYISVPFTHQWIHIKGHVAYGIFTDNTWQSGFVAPGNSYNEDVIYHSKAFFAKVGNKERFPLEFEAGFQMAAQFGGNKYISGNPEATQKMPAGFMDFLRVLIPSGGGSDAIEGEQINILGNHVGSWNVAVTAHVNDWKIRGYYEHFFEDRSQMFFGYGPWKDGRLGVEITFPKNRFINTFVYECMSTKQQTGPIYYEGHEDMFDVLSGSDNYYNNFVYNAWQHWGMSMGHPLLTGPIYNKNGYIGFRNNRVSAHHFGFSGNPGKEWKYRVLLTHSLNWGTYSVPFDECKKQFSSLVEVTYSPKKLNGWSFSLSGAMDRGNLLGNNTGGMLVVRKEGIIK